MAKTNPIGVRFRQDILDKLKVDHGVDSPQKALVFLERFFVAHHNLGKDATQILRDNPPQNKTGAKNGLKSPVEYMAPRKDAYDAPKIENMTIDEPAQSPKSKPLTFADFKALAAGGISADALDMAMNGSKLSPGEKDLVRRKRVDPK